LVRELERRFLDTDAVQTLDDIEKAVCEIREKMGQAMAEELTQALADAAEQAELGFEGGRGQENEDGPKAENGVAPRRACSWCGRERGRRGSKSRTIVTMAGEVTVMRQVYYCRVCDRCTMPVDTVLKLPEHSFTPLVEQWVARLSSKDAYARAMRDLRELAHVHVSTKEAQRITYAVGEYVQKEIRESVGKVLVPDPRSPHLHKRRPEALAKQLHDPGLTAYVYADGAQVGMDTGVWQEAKMGVVELVRKPRKEGDKPETLEKWNTFHLGGPCELAEQIWALACEMGVSELAQVVVCGDGADWIWNRVAKMFSNPIEILDYFHASKRLHEIIGICVMAEMQARSKARIVDNAGYEAECKRRYEEARQLMWEGRIDELNDYLRSLPQPTAEVADEVRKAAQHFDNHKHRMRYAEFEKMGLRIGSGPMESTCKQIVGARLKQAGARWCAAGAQVIGAIRALDLCSGDRCDKLLQGWTGRRLQAAPV
jgi:hypothetical protein